MKTFPPTFLLGLLLMSCKNKSNELELKKLFDQAKFDTTIKQDMPHYETIKQLAISNINTLFKFRNSRNIIDYYDEKGKATKQQRYESEYTFFYNRTTKEFTNYDGSVIMPDFLVPKFRSAFEQVKREIGGFTLWNDGTVEFGIGGFYDNKTDADVRHELVWKRSSIYDPQSLMKDTVIAPGWTYYISVDERQR